MASLLRLDPDTTARVERVQKELSRRSKLGEFPEVSFTSLVRALLTPGLGEYEKKYDLPAWKTVESKPRGLAALSPQKRKEAGRKAAATRKRNGT